MEAEQKKKKPVDSCHALKWLILLVWYSFSVCFYGVTDLKKNIKDIVPYDNLDL